MPGLERYQVQFCADDMTGGNWQIYISANTIETAEDIVKRNKPLEQYRNYIWRIVKMQVMKYL